MKKKWCAVPGCDKEIDGAGEFCYAHTVGLAAYRRKWRARDHYPAPAPTGKVVDVVDGALVIKKILKPTDGRLLKNRLQNKPPRYGRRDTKS